MKNILKKITMTTILLFVAAVMVACSNADTNNGEEKSGISNVKEEATFPEADFIMDGVEYEGSGKIEYSFKNESISPKQADVYISDAKVEDVVAYVQTLKSKGLKKANAYAEEQTGFNEYGSYSWIGINADDTFSISVVLSEESTPLNLVEGSYNLLISMSDSNPFAE